MLTYTQSTGSQGTMRIDDDEINNVDLYLLGVNERIVQIPWAYTVNGQMSSWQSFTLEANVAWQKLSTLWVGTSQTVTLHLGATGNVKLGGPADMSVDVKRTDAASTGSGQTRIKVGDSYHYAIPYINDNGEWKPAQAWARIAGLWKPTT